MPQSFKIVVPDAYNNIKVSAFLRSTQGFSSRLLSRTKVSGSITVNGNSVFTNYCLCGGDLLEVCLPTDKKHSVELCEIPINIVYEDEYIAIVDKPAGMPVHPSQGNYNNTLANTMLYHFNKNNQAIAFRPLSRLDKGTSGLLAISKNAYVHNILTNNMHAGSVKRRYKAIICGHITPKNGIIELPIARKEGSILEREVNPYGKNAVTLYTTIQKTKEYSLLDIELKTGRTHQIRVHLSHLGHPLVGDWLYGTEYKTIARPALHSYQLNITHPINGNSMQFNSELPEDMAAFLH